MNIVSSNSLTPNQKLLCFKFLGAGFATVALAGSGCGTAYFIWMLYSFISI